MAEAETTTPDAPEWAPFAETLRADPDLAPHLDKIPEKTVADLVKSHVHLSRKLGNSVTIPDATKAKPEEIKAFKDSVYKAGLFESPPDTYVRPAALSDETWTAPTAQEFVGIAKELGLTQKQIERLADFDVKRFADFKAPLAADMEAAKKTVTEQWAKEGKTYDEMMTLAVEGLAKRNFTADEVTALEKIGALSHPAVLSGLAKIGEAFMESNGLAGEGTGEPQHSADAGAAEAEANDIIRNKANPKYEAYHRGDAGVLAHVETLMKKAHPGMLQI